MKFYKNIVLMGLSILVSTYIYAPGVHATQNENNNINESIHKYGSDSNLSIDIKDVSLKEQGISLDENYDGIAIVTLEVKNNNDMDIELSNIDVYPYQNQNLTKCFVTTASENNITGMIGNLKSGESTQIKIGVALEDLENTLELEFINVDENQDYKKKESVDLNQNNINVSNFDNLN